MNRQVNRVDCRCESHLESMVGKPAFLSPPTKLTVSTLNLSSIDSGVDPRSRAKPATNRANCELRSRGVRILTMDRLIQDIIVSLRRLRKTPGFTAAAILTLALGIGANTAIFTAVNALILRPLPVERPDELAFLNQRGFKQEFPTLSYPNYKDYRDRNSVFTGLACYRFQPASLSQGGANNARIWAEEVTGNYFDVLGVGALQGRVLHAEDDVVRRGHPVTVITYASWQTRFGGATDIVGRHIKINGMDYTIVGVTPQGFAGVDVVFTPEFFVSMAMQPQIEPGSGWIDSRGAFNLFTLGRLKPGVGMAQAEASLNSIAAELGREYPQDDGG